MALRNRSRLRWPQPCRLIHWILALMPSDRALVTVGHDGIDDARPSGA